MATITADSCSFTDVNTAITAASAGDTVRIPSGSASWSSQLVIPFGKGIAIIGDSAETTLIDIAHTSEAIIIRGQEGYPFRVSNIGFNNNSGHVINIVGSCKNWRIDHCDFLNTDIESALIHAIFIGDMNYDGETMWSYGLIDNCHFYNCRIESICGFGHAAWKRDLSLGTTDAVYVEDCLFESSLYSDFVDGNHGERYVVRHCNIWNGPIEFHSLQNASVYYPYGFSRGTRSVELYDNNFYTRPDWFSPHRAIFVRGGTGVVFNNTVTNGEGDVQYNYLLDLDNVRSFESPPSPLYRAMGNNAIDGNTAVDSGTGSHTGADDASVLSCSGKTWTSSAFVSPPHYVYNITDGSLGLISANTANTVTATLSGGTDNHWDSGDSFKITNGYPALDQIGFSTDAGEEETYQPQESVPMYCFNNIMDDVQQNVHVANNTEHHIQADRDFFDYSASFTGVSGVGVGLLSARPSSGLTVGVGYWATDTSTLYRATGATTWETYYTPYAYPHPLQAAGATYALTIDPESRTISAGAAASYTVNSVADDGYTGNVTLSVAGLPSGASAEFSDNPIDSDGGTSALTITTTAGATVGVHPLVLNGEEA